jgi:hypothetical protein
MSGKNQYVSQFDWQSTDPRVGFQPTHPPGGSTPSGTHAGVMTGVNVIYTNIIDVAKMDNLGLELNWTGTPTGVIEVMGSVSGLNFYAITFSPAIGQPSGSASGELVQLAPYSFKYYMLRYTNTSGVGSITAYTQFKDLN